MSFANRRGRGRGYDGRDGRGYEGRDGRGYDGRDRRGHDGRDGRGYDEREGRGYDGRGSVNQSYSANRRTEGNRNQNQRAPIILAKPNHDHRGSRDPVDSESSDRTPNRVSM